MFGAFQNHRFPFTLPPMRVLVVEDDAKIASFIVQGFKQSGFAVDHADEGEAGLALAETTDYDAAIVDIMLPRLDGLSLVRRLRAARRPIPVLFLSAKSSVDDRVRGLEIGGDDYLTKPFSFSELLARVQALIRRSSRSPESTKLVSGDVMLDLVSREVTCAGQPVDLQPREFSLLAFLLRHAKEFRKSDIVVVCLSGRGDKDVDEVQRILNLRRSHAL